jgi:hypothetical protein
MKTLFTATLLGIAASATALTNGDFETGDLTGWEIFASCSWRPVIIPEYTFPLSTTPLGQFITVESGLGNDGSFGAKILNWQGKNINGTPFTGPDGIQYNQVIVDYTTGIFQDVRLAAGTIVTGWAHFGTSDWPMYSDYASVTFNGVEVWYFDLKMVTVDEKTGEKSAPWQSWQFVAPADGTYRLSLSVYGDDQLNSWCYFDNIQIVPEPATFSLLTLAAAGVLIFRRRR